MPDETAVIAPPSAPSSSEPSAAIVSSVAEAHEQTIQERLDRATSQELKTWQEKGDIPPAKPPKEAKPAKAAPQVSAAKPEVAANEDPAVIADPPPAPADPAAASPAVPPQKKTKTDERFEKLFNAWEKDRRELEELRRTPPIAAKPDSQPAAGAPRPKPTLNDLAADGKTPKYGTVEDYLEDRDTWLREEIHREADERQAAKQRDTQHSQQREAIQKGWQGKVEKARGKYADFDAVVLQTPDLPFRQGGIIDASVLKYDEGAELAYYFTQHPEEAARIDNMDVFDAHAEVLKVREQFRAPSGITETESSNTSSARPPAPNLPPPPTILGARSTVARDEAEAALAKGDVAAYMRAANARELAARRK